MRAPARRPRIYAAHPQTSYGTPQEAGCLDALARQLPGAEIVDPSRLYSTDAGWLADWPKMLGSLSGLVVFADAGATIGAGCWREIGDALARRLPVAVLEGRLLRELAGIELLPVGSRSPRRVGFLVSGRSLADGYLPGLSPVDNLRIHF